MLQANSSNINIRIEVNKADLERISKLSTEITNKGKTLLRQLAQDVVNKWSEIATERIKTPERYIEAVKNAPKEYESETKLEIAIFPEFPMTSNVSGIKHNLGLLLEYGYEPFDMKDKILQISNKKVIRFAYGVGNSSGLKMPKQVENLAKQHVYFSNYSLGSRKNPAAQKLSDLYFQPNSPPNLLNYKATKFPQPGKEQVMGSDPNISNSFTWKTGQFKGLKTSKSDILGKTMSVFRTISKKSPANSWIHPGMRPKNIFKDTEIYIKPVIKTAFENFVLEICE